MTGFSIFPASASDHAGQVDLLLGTFTGLVVLLSGPVFLLIIGFAIYYRRGRDVDRDHRISGSLLLESAWAVVPFLAVLLFYVWALKLFVELQEPPAGAYEVQVIGKQWMWKFQHPSGVREINQLHVPVGVPIKLVMTSQDVIHSLYIPALRLKQDVVPGRYTAMWFNATQPGTYPLRCAEYCGTNHSVMGGQFVAMRGSDHARWLARGDNDPTIAARGERLFVRFGCSGCHAAGSAVHAPPLAGLYGSPVPLADGSIVIADDQYLHDSIVQPNRQVAKGYQPIMPAYGDVLDEGQVFELVSYLKMRKAEPWGAR